MNRFFWGMAMAAIYFFNAQNSNAQQNFYWVGGTGNWSDVSNWATTSGGTNYHSVIPSLEDRVIFDENSFTEPGQTVRIDVDQAACNDMDWSRAGHYPALVGSRNVSLSIGGSLTLIEDMQFLFEGSVRFESGTERDTIVTAGHLLNEAYFDGSGGWILQGEMGASHISIQNGRLNTNGQAITANYFEVGDGHVGLTLGNSLITINGNFVIQNPETFTMDPGGSQLVFISTADPTLYVNTTEDVEFNNITFEHPDCTGHITGFGDNSMKFNKVTMHGNGAIMGNNTFDTLNFSPGKTFELQSGKTQTITGEWNLSGACSPTILHANIPGIQANVSTSGSISAYHVAMQDQNAIGGGTFNVEAGTDISNNSGWHFEETSSLNNFFGNDTTLLEGDTLVLYAPYYFNGNYLWNDGTVNSSLAVTDPGEYFVTIDLGSNCQMTDTIVVDFIPETMLSLGPDTTLCEGQVWTLGGTTGLQGFNYLWQDGSTNTSIAVDTTGMYHVTMSKGTLVYRDTALITFNAPPVLNLVADTTLCFDQVITLDVSASNASYYWTRDGGFFSGEPVVSIISPGLYEVEVTNACGSARGEIRVLENDFRELYLGEDTTLNEGETLLLDATTPHATYLWQDGSTNATFTVTTEGTYWVEVTRGCVTLRDEIFVGREVRRCEIYMPTAFSPNGDSRNDFFAPKFSCGSPEDYEMRIYDRRGKLVYIASNTRGWDGTHNGSKLPVGAYIYKVLQKGLIIKKGTVTLIR